MTRTCGLEVSEGQGAAVAERASALGLMGLKPRSWLHPWRSGPSSPQAVGRVQLLAVGRTSLLLLAVDWELLLAPRGCPGLLSMSSHRPWPSQSLPTPALTSRPALRGESPLYS